MVDQLKTLQHRHLQFTDYNLEFIRQMLSSERSLAGLSDCKQLYHPSHSCFQYKGVKLGIALRNALLLNSIATLLPALIKNHRRLRNDFNPTVKRILLQFAKSVCWLTLLCFLPAISMCHIIKLTGRLTKTAALICFGLGQISWCFENISKHQQYAGFLTPKAVEILYTALRQNTQTPELPLLKILPFVLAGMIGIAASRGHYQS